MAHEARALVIEKNRLRVVKARFLGIVGDRNHSYGYHLAASDLPDTDYSREGRNENVDDWGAACAIDIGMDWPASRKWLRWLIEAIRTDRIKGIAEVIGSYDGKRVRYWSDGSGWATNGVEYDGSGHDTWTHVAIYRNDTKTDRGLLKGWTPNGYEGDDDMPTAKEVWDYNVPPGADIDEYSDDKSWRVSSVVRSAQTWAYRATKDTRVLKREFTALKAMMEQVLANQAGGTTTPEQIAEAVAAGVARGTPDPAEYAAAIAAAVADRLPDTLTDPEVVREATAAAVREVLGGLDEAS